MAGCPRPFEPSAQLLLNTLVTPTVESAVWNANVLDVILAFEQDMETGVVPGVNDLNITLDVGGEVSFDTTTWLTARRLRIRYTDLFAEPSEGDFVYVNSVGFLRDLLGQQYAGFNIDDIPIT
jgi:hypothetical protein